MLSGELFDVREAQSMSSVNRVLPADKILAGRVPGEKGRWSPYPAVQQDKRLIERSFELTSTLAAPNHAKELAHADLSGNAPRDAEGRSGMRSSGNGIPHITRRNSRDKTCLGRSALATTSQDGLDRQCPLLEANRGPSAEEVG